MQPLYDQLDHIYSKKALNHRTYQIMQGFIKSYSETLLKGGGSVEKALTLLGTYLERLEYLHAHPFVFEPYHQRVLEPFNYYQFGLDFIRPLVNFQTSVCQGKENLDRMQEQLKNQHNIILLANHQTEVDPQFIEFLIEKDYPEIGEEMISVAGGRVLFDPLAIPVSMGRNLLCVYSKKHISNPPEQMEAKRLHNKKTMELMSQLLKEGGHCIYVAPSGGRDRPKADGSYPIDQLDPQSIEFFNIMAQKSKVPTHFYSLSLLTYRVFPPPKDLGVELGEERITSYSGIYAYFGKEIDMEGFAGYPIENKIERRHKRSDFIWNQINQDYQSLIQLQDQYD